MNITKITHITIAPKGCRPKLPRMLWANASLKLGLPPPPQTSEYAPVSLYTTEYNYHETYLST